MEAEQLLRSGDIAGARAWLAGELRRSPANVQLRQFFWQLVALEGEWDKADQQLRALAAAEPKAMMLGSVYSQAIAAMKTRDAVMSGQLRPQSIVGTEPWVDGLLDALHAHMMGSPDAGARSDVALEAAPATPGSLNGDPFEWIADADLRFGPVLEVIVGENYGFIPFAALKRIKVAEPADLRDTVWLPVELETLAGQTSMAFVPVTYPGTIASKDAALILARRTDWVELNGGEVGLGQRLLATDGPESAILALRDVRFG